LNQLGSEIFTFNEKTIEDEKKCSTLIQNTFI